MNQKFLKDYLPDEFFINLSEEQRISFRKLRESHLLVQKKNKKLSVLKKEIKEKQKELKELTVNIGTKNHLIATSANYMLPPNQCKIYQNYLNFLYLLD